MNRVLTGAICLIFLFSIFSCAGPEYRDSEPPVPPPSLARIRYTIQAGAFAVPANAYRLLESLRTHGLDAYHFRDTDGLYRVRFGDFATRQEAEDRAVNLRSRGIIEAFYIVSPDKYHLPVSTETASGYRDILVETAQRFLGVDYRYGGTDPDTGFDCSGLVMTVYKLNGLNLPRTAREQYQAGKSVRKSDLRPGDLVFFSTSAPGQVSHVGLFISTDKFIHAPGRNKPVRYARLSDPYFRDRFLGARTYTGY